jgi:nicotinamidase-related amidase
MTDSLSLDPKRTALVLIDLQAGILGMQVAPRPATEVLDRSVKLAEHFRSRQALVVLVNVSFGPGNADRLTQPVDAQMAGDRPAGWDVLSPKLGDDVRDLRITKRQWGAFYGTPLDLHLRRRGIDTIVIGGISTNFGVEGTARDAFERSYAVVFVEDATAGPSKEAHEFAVKTIFPRIGRVRSAQQVTAAL